MGSVGFDDVVMGTTTNKDDGQRQAPSSKTGEPQNTPSLATYFHMKQKVDNLYHFGLDTAADDLPKMFGNTEVVCMMGSEGRAEAFAQRVELLERATDANGKAQNTSEESASAKQQWQVCPQNLSKSDRCKLYSVADGKVLVLSHGMGNPSLLIFLHELVKLLYHAKVDLAKVVCVRLGTAGGVGVPAGTVCITDKAMDEAGEWGLEYCSLGKKQRFPAVGDAELNLDLLHCGQRGVEHKPDIHVQLGHTLTSNDYYESQGRLDGALPTPYDECEQRAWLLDLQQKGVVSMEMEATGVLSFFQRAGMKAAVVAVALLDRTKGDQHVDGRDKIKEYSKYPQMVVINYLQKRGIF